MGYRLPVVGMPPATHYKDPHRSVEWVRGSDCSTNENPSGDLSYVYGSLFGSVVVGSRSVQGVVSK